MGKLVGALVIATALGTSAFFYAASASPEAGRVPVQAEPTDQERQEYHRYLVYRAYAAGVGLDECEAKLPKESWLPAWRRGGYAAVQEAEIDAAHECCVRSIGLGAGVGATFDDPCAPATPMSREKRKRVAAEAEWAAREEEAKRQAWWKTAGDPELVYGSASEVLEIVQEEEAKRQAESEDDPLAGLAIEEDTAPPKRRTPAKSRSQHRKPKPTRTWADDPADDPLGLPLVL
jgi:hypothetical protein